MIAIDLIKQKAVKDGPKIIKHTNFAGNLDRNLNVNTAMFFMIEETNETILDFDKELWGYYNLIFFTLM